MTNLSDWRFFFTSGGGEALEAAIKTARYYWQRRGQPNKHQFLCTMCLSWDNIGYAQRDGFCCLSNARFFPCARHASCANTRDTTGLVNGTISGCATTADRNIGAEHLAAILIEPVWAAGGTYSAPREYWAGVQQLCQRYDLLLIADEVVTRGDVAPAGGIRCRSVCNQTCLLCQRNYQRLYSVRRCSFLANNQRVDPTRTTAASLVARPDLFSASCRVVPWRWRTCYSLKASNSPSGTALGRATATRNLPRICRAIIRTRDSPSRSLDRNRMPATD